MQQPSGDIKDLPIGARPANQLFGGLLLQENETMKAHDPKDFNERRNSAAAAKQAALEKFRAQPKPDDPEVLARIAERKAIGDARDARAAERELVRKAEAERLAAEEEMKRIELAAIEAAAAAEKAAEVVRLREVEVERKKARDAKYAARKARR